MAGQPAPLESAALNAWTYLAIAICAEVLATSALNQSDGMTRPLPAVLSVIGYAAAFWCLSLCLREIPVGIAYAIWAGAGIVLIGLIGWIVFQQKLDLAAITGMTMIIGGVIVIQVFSKTVNP